MVSAYITIVYIIFIIIIASLVLYLFKDKIRIPNLNLKKKKKQVIVGKSAIPPEKYNSALMEKIGDMQGMINQLQEDNKKLKEKYTKEAEINISKEIKKKEFMEKLKIIKKGTHFLPNSFKGAMKLTLVGEDGVLGKLISLIEYPSPSSIYVYYYEKNGENYTPNLLGPKRYDELIKTIDKDSNSLFIRFNKNKKYIPEKLFHI